MPEIFPALENNDAFGAESIGGGEVSWVSSLAVFGDVLREASPPSTDSVGIGGDENTIWHADGDADLVYELSTSDFSVVRSSSSPDTNAQGIGGTSSTIWHADFSATLLYELDTSDFSVIRSSSPPSSSPNGMGGTGSTLWHADFFDGMYELDTSDFSAIRNPRDITDNKGIGGDSTVIYMNTPSAPSAKHYKLDPSDFSTIATHDFEDSGGNFVDTENGGIGGNSSVVWADAAANGTSGFIWELAPP